MKWKHLFDILLHAGFVANSLIVFFIFVQINRTGRYIITEPYIPILVSETIMAAFIFIASMVYFKKRIEYLADGNKN